jgi:hypothetical protein
LEPDPENEHDSLAVRVSMEGATVGFLARPDAARYLDELERAGHSGASVQVFARIVGGWRTNQHDAGHFGVFLGLPWPVRVAGP